jgi:glutamate formiminotransferase / formiminotetrahydrofolate cyclodeaminase
MAESGNPNSISDAGVAALCARSAVIGAFMNVKINASGYNDKYFTDAVISEGNDLEKKAVALEKEIIELVNLKIS